MTAPEQPTPTLDEQIAAVKRFISASVSHANYYGPDNLHPDTAAMRAVLATLEDRDRFAAQRAAEAVSQERALNAAARLELETILDGAATPPPGDAANVHFGTPGRVEFHPAETPGDAGERARDFSAAVDCAHTQYENYVRQGQLSTEDERRAALRDALSHAVGILKLRSYAALQSERTAAASEISGDAFDVAKNVVSKWNFPIGRDHPAEVIGAARDRIVELIALALHRRAAAASQARAERDAVILRLTRRLADAEQRASQTRRELLIKLCNECDRIKATFPGNKKHGLYDPGDARTVWDCACDRLRATICALTTPQESAQARRVRYARYCGPMDAAECQRIMRAPLYQLGDAILVWVNEGDILASGEEVATPQESA